MGARTGGRLKRLRDNFMQHTTKSENACETCARRLGLLHPCAATQRQLNEDSLERFPAKCQTLDRFVRSKEFDCGRDVAVVL